MKRTNKILCLMLALMLLCLAACSSPAPADKADSSAPPAEAPAAQETVDIGGNTVPLLNDIEALASRSGNNLGVQPLKDSANAIDRKAALDTALTRATGLEPSAVNAVLASFTDNAQLNDAPAWLVTFQDVMMDTQGGAGKILADSTVVIDAYTGEILEVISYSV